MRTVLDKLTYANVTATLALFVALGGTSYAALTLPRDSVGDRQIRTSAVRSSEIKDRSVSLRDVSLAARSSLRGRRGPSGAPGPQGAPGASAVRFFAVVSSGGVLLRGNATGGGSEGGIGNYAISFASATTGCASSATLGTTDASSTVPGRILVRDLGGRVGVQTFDAAGSPADLPFHLIVAC